jgi:hypothetical protein
MECGVSPIRLLKKDCAGKFSDYLTYLAERKNYGVFKHLNFNEIEQIFQLPDSRLKEYLDIFTQTCDAYDYVKKGTLT